MLTDMRYTGPSQIARAEFLRDNRYHAAESRNPNLNRAPLPCSRAWPTGPFLVSLSSAFPVESFPSGNAPTIVNRITIALSKGRIFDETLPLLGSAGIRPNENPEASRRLIIGTNREDVNIVIVRASDVPTYVRYGAADLGIAGKDVLHEGGAEGLYQPLDLKIARCRMIVAASSTFDYGAAVRQGARLRVATKYLRTAREHFAAKGVHVDLIKLYGSMELAPLVGLADAIVDLVSTGNTLRANNLVVVEEIMPISARLIVNQAALKLKDEVIQPLLRAFARAIEPADTRAEA
jgi:ATP phosphoribosyltransferase